MEHYKLNKSEVVLFRNDILLLEDGKKGKNKVKTELLLTNENFVFINKSKKLFQKETVDTIVVAIESMKIYNEMPYMVRKDELVEIYTIDDEYFLEFDNKKSAKEFFNKTMRVASGYSKFVRGVKKVGKEVSDANEALNISGTTKKALDFVADVAIEYTEAPKKGKVQLIGSVAKVFKKRDKKENLQITDGEVVEQTMLPPPTIEEGK